MNHLRFADDLVLFEEKLEHLEKMNQDLNTESKKIGHDARYSGGEMEQGVTECYLRDGNRSCGRPRRRWMDDIKLTAGHLWTRVAQDRLQWKSLEEAYAKKHIETRDIL
ncbi:hypothetical protein EVAR_100464_1 [Eumeta japonica]|uniref:Uncharacterized protein n=1 Tax=Eumeta variegata TaxID=151549 RepID=A0A4C2A427_EUMVA|nr:hypothetical protein EVAR_100464_1 [Eumeta japonica]